MSELVTPCSPEHVPRSVPTNWLRSGHALRAPPQTTHTTQPPQTTHTAQPTQTTHTAQPTQTTHTAQPTQTTHTTQPTQTTQISQPTQTTQPLRASSSATSRISISASSLTAPTSTINKYHFLAQDKLGSGSFSTVYRGCCVSGSMNGRAVAIKQINKQSLMKDTKLQMLFQTEIDIMKQLGHHPHIARLVDYYETRDGKHSNLVLELCDSGDLDMYMKRNSLPLPVSHTADVTRQIASGMQYLYSLGVVHRDLKPHNILLHRDSTRLVGYVLKITDFGFAIRLQQQDMTATFCGSPLHMAPEILLRSRYDPKVDLFSVGTIVYKMAVGHEPYMARSTGELVKRIKEARLQRQPLPLPQSVCCDRDLKALLVGLLQLDPKQRISFEAFFSHPYLQRPLHSESQLQHTSSEHMQRSGVRSVNASINVCTAPIAAMEDSTNASTAAATSDIQRGYVVVDRYAVDFSDSLARIKERPCIATKTSRDKDLESILQTCTQSTVEQVDLIFELALKGTNITTPRGHAERLLLYGRGLAMLRKAVCKIRDPLRCIEIRPSYRIMICAERFRAAFAHCTSTITSLQKQAAPDATNAIKGLQAAVSPDDFLRNRAQEYIAQAVAMRERWVGPTDAQWRLRKSVLMAAQSVLDILYESLREQSPSNSSPKDAESAGSGIAQTDTMTCVSRERLARQMQHVQDLLRQPKPLAVPIMSSHPNHPNYPNCCKPLSSSSLFKARFCGSCGARFAKGGDYYCMVCGAHRALLSSGTGGISGVSDDSSISYTPKNLAKTVT